MLSITVCKHWLAISKASWDNLNSLNTDTRDWGMKKKINDKNFKTIFSNILDRCGNFLTHLEILSADSPYDYVKVDLPISNIIVAKCPNIQDIDIEYSILADYVRSEEVETIKPIFDKVKKFRCSFRNIIDKKCVEDLFSLNNKMESLDISFREGTDVTVLNALPYKTMRELTIGFYSYDIPFYQIFQVSLFLIFEMILLHPNTHLY